jgi:hypothetical protein
VSGENAVQENSDKQIALFVRDDKTGRLAFNTEALKAFGVDPADARERGYPLAEHVKSPQELVA